MRRIVISVVVGLFILPGLAMAEGGGFDEELFEIFLKARVLSLIHISEPTRLC